MCKVLIVYYRMFGHIFKMAEAVDQSSTDDATAGLLPPEFTYDVFERCMDYAVEVNWGK
jgi:hypothetical protein